jgi:AraC family transcriptional regulator
LQTSDVLAAERVYGMSILNDLQKTVDYIEKNIKSKITLEDIASSLYISKYHFHRVFRAATNIKLMEYVRMRQLSLSLNDLLYTDLKIKDIAAEYGFEHEQSYTKSFKKAFGISPSQFRSKRRQVPIIDKLDLSTITDLENAIILSPSFVVKPKFYIVGTEHFVLVDENYNTNLTNKLAKDFYYAHREKITNAVDPNILISLSVYEAITSNESTYLPALEVTDLDSVPIGMTGKKISTHKYAVFKYIGFHSANDITLKNLNSIYSHLLTWFRYSQYIQDGGFHFEMIDNRISKADYCEADIYIPVRIKEPPHF